MPAASARAPLAEHAAGCAYELQGLSRHADERAEQAQGNARVGSQRDRGCPELKIVSSRHRSSIQHECAVMEIRSRTLAIPVARERTWCSGWEKALIAYWKIIQGPSGSGS
jgi:hypothetical protein